MGAAAYASSKGVANCALRIRPAGPQRSVTLDVPQIKDKEAAMLLELDSRPISREQTALSIADPESTSIGGRVTSGVG